MTNTTLVTQDKVKTPCIAIYTTTIDDKELSFGCGRNDDHTIHRFLIEWETRNDT